MNSNLISYLFFTLSLLAGIAMIAEGCLIVLFKRQITPIPMRILAVLGIAKAPGHGSPVRDLTAYARYVWVLGPLLVIASFIYLFSGVLR